MSRWGCWASSPASGPSSTALAAGVSGLVLDGLVVAAVEGGPGTGCGIVGGFVALAVGLVAAVLGAVALKKDPLSSWQPALRADGYIRMQVARDTAIALFAKLRKQGAAVDAKPPAGGGRSGHRCPDCSDRSIR
ncbi:DUF6223 family protein [Nocardia sp. NPDC004573]